MARRRAEWWQARVAEVERGASETDVAERHGVALRLLGWWRAEFARRARPSREPAKTTRLLPVVVKNSPAPPAASMEIVLESGDVRIRVRGLVRAKHLEAIVRGLAAR